MRIFKSKSKKLEAVQFDVQPPTTPPAQDGLALAVIVRNEEAAIDEWIAYHQAAGVRHFILYDDNCTDETLSISRTRLAPQDLTILPWGQRIQDAKQGRALHSQGLAFAHAVANFCHFRWIGFIDVDEFLFPTEAVSLTDALAELDHADNIYLPWQMFGRQGYAKTPDVILPRYTLRYRDPAESPVKGLFNFKCIVNPAKVSRAYVHGFLTNSDTQIWNSRGESFQQGTHRTKAFTKNPTMRLNHYYAKSDAQLAEKIAKGSIGASQFTRAFKSFGGRKDLLTRRVEEIERNVVEDRGIIDYCQRIGFKHPK